MLLRVCTAMTPALGTYENGQVTGMLGPLYTAALEILEPMGNLTIFAVEKMGDMVDKERELYDGCLGRLQNNQSDTLMPMMDFPILGPGMTQTFPIWWQKTMIVSTYDSRISQQGTDVMDAFHSFAPHLWALTAITFACFLVMIPIVLLLDQSVTHLKQMKRLPNLRRSIRPLVSQTWTMVLGNVIHQNSSYHVRSEKLHFRCQLLLLVVYAFLISFYFTSMIKTEMVVHKRPDTMSSYQDILDRPHVRPYWFRALRDHIDFEQADPLSPEGRVWQRASQHRTEREQVRRESGNDHEDTARSESQRGGGLAARLR